MYVLLEWRGRGYVHENDHGDGDGDDRDQNDPLNDDPLKRLSRPQLLVSSHLRHGEPWSLHRLLEYMRVVEA